ncbi:hypothetical protein ACUOA8_62970, partial [Escherichia sp. SS-MK2]
MVEQRTKLGDRNRDIARTFGAEQSYIVTNGTSTSNKIVG